MFYFLPEQIKGLLAISLYTANTIVLSVPLILCSLIKFCVPVKSVIVLIDRALISIATAWIMLNTLNTCLFCRIDWDVRGLESLDKKEWYLVLSNHQSWVDIIVLQTLLNGKIPMLKFFLKKELIWVPFLGLAWWALDFPFMKRYTRQELIKKPRLKGQDLESTKKACEKFKNTPVSIINFVEGTRFTPEKKKKQKAALTHLLSPKAGGIAFVLGSMGDYLHKIIDVTIVYPDGIPTFWKFISGGVRQIIVDFQIIPITEDLKGDYFNDPVYKEHFFTWINQLWHAKDERIKQLKEG